MLVCILLWIAISAGDCLFAQAQVDTEQIQFRAEMGLGGYWKVGFPTRTAIDITSGANDVDGFVEIKTFDGDGVAVVYQSESWKVKLQPKSSLQIEVIAKHGRGNRPILLRLVGRDGNLVYERELRSEERGTVLPATQPLVVGIGGDKLDLSKGAMKSARGALPDHSTVQLANEKQLPLSSLGYSGVDVLILSSSNPELNRRMDPVRASAIQNWIAQGGRCVLSLGENVESWLRTTEFRALIPGEFSGVATDCDPGPLESHLGSQSRLANLQCCLLSNVAGTVDLDFRKNRTKYPMIARWAFGAGKVVFVAVELESAPILAWESRPNLLQKLLDDQWEKRDATTDKRVYLGYDDIAGQLNSTLDNFPLLTLGNLASISILVGLFCLVIGPVDYFLVSRTWRKPSGTWITLLVCSLGSCLFVAGLARRWKPEMPSINSLELLEIDYQTQMLRGRCFMHCYGGNRGTFDFSANRRSQGLNSATKNARRKVQLDWFGQPGKGLGGFESTVATDRGMPAYKIDAVKNEPQWSSDNLRSEGKSGIDGAYGIQGVGIPAAGTKSFCASWQESISLLKETNSLSMVAGSIDLLEGSFENPLDVDLLDSLLIYCGRAYTLDTRIRVGQRVSFSASTVPKDITRRLQRRQNIGGEERSTPWDPADAGKLDRLMELISFHESAGSSKYTGLYNRYLSELDCSDVIRLDRAILICEFKDSSLVWSMRRNSVPIQATEGQRKTFLRLIIPVSKFKPASPVSGSANPAIGQKP